MFRLFLVFSPCYDGGGGGRGDDFAMQCLARVRNLGRVEIFSFHKEWDKLVSSTTAYQIASRPASTSIGLIRVEPVGLAQVFLHSSDRE